MSESEESRTSLRLHDVYQEAYEWCKDARPLAHPWEWERHALLMVRRHVLTEGEAALTAGHYGPLTIEIPSAIEEVGRARSSPPPEVSQETEHLHRAVGGHYDVAPDSETTYTPPEVCDCWRYEQDQTNECPLHGEKTGACDECCGTGAAAELGSVCPACRGTGRTPPESPSLKTTFPSNDDPVAEIGEWYRENDFTTLQIEGGRPLGKQPFQEAHASPPMAPGTGRARKKARKSRE